LIVTTTWTQVMICTGRLSSGTDESNQTVFHTREALRTMAIRLWTPHNVRIATILNATTTVLS